jgi:protein-S-isoprenylcysteine O-methyltransferase Ste14
MSRTGAIIASCLHFAAAPGVVVGAIPWLITGWESGEPMWPAAIRIVGAIVAVGGLSVVAAEFARFVREGGGSPAPPAPTRRLVTGGLYRHVRNPMYVSVILAIVGQAMMLSRPALFVYAGAVAICVTAFVRAYEEPTLARSFGDEYDHYREAVPRWWPRVRLRRP